MPMAHTILMLTSSKATDLSDHLCRHSQLSPTDAARLIEEVLAYFDESAQDFIRRRHHELQKTGLANAVIYDLISAEIAERRFVQEPMTQRQIRRTIYG